MTSKDRFPEPVREVIDFIECGKLLSGPYLVEAPSTNQAVQTPVDYIEVSTAAIQFNALEEALLCYQDQDVEPPYYFLPDITAEALGDIPVATSEEQRELNRALIEYEEEHNFYEVIKERMIPLATELNIEMRYVDLLADMISGDLYHCVKARLLMEDSHPYFEQMLNVYRQQGLPVGWIGSESPEDGEFVIYTRDK